MIMADVLMWFLLVVGLLLVFNSYWLATVALFPNLVQRSQSSYANPFKLFGVGVLVMLPLAGLGVLAAAANHPAARVAGFGLIGAATFVGLMGSAGLARQMGTGLASPADAVQPWRRVLRGGIVLSLVFLLPFLGWFLVLPLTLITGAGAFVLSLKKPSKAPQSSSVQKDDEQFAMASAAR